MAEGFAPEKTEKLFTILNDVDQIIDIVDVNIAYPLRVGYGDL